MGANPEQPFKVPNNVDVLAEVKKYGTDISLYLACQDMRISQTHQVPLKYRVKAVLLYPFHEHHSDAAKLYDAQWNKGDSHRVPRNLQNWLQGSFYFDGALRKYLSMTYSSERVPIRKTTEDLFEVMERYIDYDEGMCTFVEILKHMQRTGTIKRILPKMKKSKLFGVGFLHAWFTGSLCQYLDKFYDHWVPLHTAWLQTLLRGLTKKDFDKMLRSLPWTRVMFLLGHMADGETVIWNYAVSVLPSYMCEPADAAVPSLLSLSLVQVVREHSDFFAKNEFHELSLFEQLANSIPHDLAETVPLILLLSQRHKFLADQSLIFVKILNTAFGWFARKQLLRSSVSIKTMIAWQEHGPPVSDTELIRFAQQRSLYDICELLRSVQERIPERQINLLKCYNFRWAAQKRCAENLNTAKRLKMTVDQFVEWSQFETTELREMFLEDQKAGY